MGIANVFKAKVLASVKWLSAQADALMLKNDIEFLSSYKDIFLKASDVSGNLTLINYRLLPNEDVDAMSEINHDIGTRISKLENLTTMRDFLKQAQTASTPKTGFVEWVYHSTGEPRLRKSGDFPLNTPKGRKYLRDNETHHRFIDFWELAWIEFRGKKTHRELSKEDQSELNEFRRLLR